jgi:hypothetical protein
VSGLFSSSSKKTEHKNADGSSDVVEERGQKGGFTSFSFHSGFFHSMRFLVTSFLVTSVPDSFVGGKQMLMMDDD